MSVSMKPGETALTVMLREPYSRASVFERPRRADFESEYRPGRRCHLADDAREEDHPAGSWRIIVLMAARAQASAPFNVDREDPIDVLFLHAKEEPIDGDAAVGDEDVEATESFGDLRDGLLARPPCRRRRSDRFGLAALGFDGGDGLLRLFFAAHIGEDDVRALRRECLPPSRARYHAKPPVTIATLPLNENMAFNPLQQGTKVPSRSTRRRSRSRP